MPQVPLPLQDAHCDLCNTQHAAIARRLLLDITNAFQFRSSTNKLSSAGSPISSSSCTGSSSSPPKLEPSSAARTRSRSKRSTYSRSYATIPSYLICRRTSMGLKVSFLKASSALEPQRVATLRRGAIKAEVSVCIANGAGSFWFSNGKPRC